MLVLCIVLVRMEVVVIEVILLLFWIIVLFGIFSFG